MKLRPRHFAAAAAVVTLIGVTAAVFAQATATESVPDAQTGPHPMMGQPMPGHDPGMMPGMMCPHGAATMDMSGGHGAPKDGAHLAVPGQDAFGAIQEIVARLEADPNTDWSKVDLEALRQHLIDMNEVTLKADAAAKPIEGGLAIAVTGGGRTLAAIQSMIPAHAKEINGLNGWSVKTEPIANGVLLTVTAEDAKEVQRIRGLGFIGILVSGSHHQLHHFAMVKGGLPHRHGM